MTLKDGSTEFLDASDEDECNWLCLVGVAQSEANCMAVQMGPDIYYLTMHPIAAQEELQVWYAPHYARKLKKSPTPDARTRGQFASAASLKPMCDNVATFPIISNDKK